MSSLEPIRGMVYHGNMTLQTRNYSFRAGTAVSGAAILFLLFASFAAFSAYPEAMEKNSYRAGGMIQWLITGQVKASAYIPLISVIGSVLFSFVSITLIRFSFVKTQSEEIFYIGFFVTTMAFECFRVMAPLALSRELPEIYLYISSRLLIFSRCFGLFSLFAAGIFAAGLKMKKHRNIIISLGMVAMVLALSIPVDSSSLDSSFNVHSGYASMFKLIETGLPLITVLSFLIAAYNRSAKEYITISLGIIMVFIGRDILINSDTVITPLPGMALLYYGTWLVCSRLHRVYLWL